MTKINQGKQNDKIQGVSTASALTNNNQVHRRIEYIDFAKFIAIVFVCLGHAVQYLSVLDFFLDNPIWNFIYSFHMPFFMILSGFFFSRSINKSFKDLVVKKITQLIIPSWVWGVGIGLMFVALNLKNPLSFEEWVAIPFGPYWFLTSVFACYVISYLAKRWISKDIFASILSIILISAIPFFNECNISTMLPFFWTGYFLSKYQDKIFNYSSVLLFGFMILYFLLFLNWNSRFTVYMTEVDFIHFSSPYIDFNNLFIVWYRYGIGLCGSLFFILLSYKIVCKWNTNSMVRYAISIGTSTLSIYLIQYYSLEIMLSMLALNLSLPQVCIYAFPIAMIEVLVCWMITQQINKIPILKSILFGYSMSIKKGSVVKN